MRKSILITSLFSITLVLFTGCSSKNTSSIPQKVEGECIIAGEKAPLWACGSYEESDRYTAVGSAPISKLGFDFSRNEALMHAKTNLVNQIELDIKNKAESYMRSTGLKDNEMVEKVVTQVSKQTSKMTLKNTKQISYWQNSGDNSIYLLVAIDKATINNDIENAVKEIADLEIKNSEDALNKLQ